jgi:hypothetical protein
LLKKLKPDKYIRLKEEPDKDAMAAMTDEEPATVDVVQKIKDDFSAKPTGNSSGSKSPLKKRNSGPP